jgi:hypothetical protein
MSDIVVRKSPNEGAPIVARREWGVSGKRESEKVIPKAPAAVARRIPIASGDKPETSGRH